MSDNRSISTPLAADEVHVWAVPLDGSHVEVSLRRKLRVESGEARGERQETIKGTDDLSTLRSPLSPLESERAEQFMRDDLRRRFVVAHKALRTILGRYLAVAPHDVPIDYGPHGKPRLTEARSREQGAGRSSLLPAPSPLHFNLAHSGELAVVAVTRDGEIGVDVERLRPVRHLEQLARRYFAPSEVAAIMAAVESCRDAEFLAVWTAKEAILKAIGTGLSYPLDRFAVAPAVDRQWVTLSQPPADCSDKWWLARVLAASGYVAAVATDSQKKLCPTFHYPDDLEREYARKYLQHRLVSGRRGG